MDNVTGSASSEIGGYYASQAVDGDLSTLWYTDWNDPVAYSGTKTFTIDLKQAYKLDKFEYYNDGTAQIKDHEIQVSRDGVNFKTVEKSVWVRPSTGTFNVFVDLNGEIARYVRIISYDKHHNSANEFRVYKVDGTEGFSEADVSTDGALGDPDLTFLENYMGVRKDDDLATFNQAVTGDINYNNEIDAYDLMFVTSKIANLESTGRKAGGEITFTTDKKSVKAGEEVEVSIYGNNLKDINAFGLRYEIDPELYELSSTNPVIASDETKDMHNSSRTLRNDKGVYVAFSNIGKSESLQGDMLLATFKMKAKVDTEVSLQPENTIVISSGFDVRSAFGLEKQPADIELLEDTVFIAEALDKSIYSSESVNILTSTISEAQNVLDNIDASQEDADNALINIINALNGLERITQPNSEVLEILIEKVTSNDVQANIETRELENFFINYVDPARSSLQSGTSTSIINEHINTLITEFIQLHDNNGTTDYANEVFLQFANDLVTSLESTYTSKSLAVLSSAISTNDFDTIKEAVLNLKKIDLLDKNILSAVIEIAQSVNESKFDSEAIKQLKASLTSAITVLEDTTVNQEATDKAMEQLSNNIIGLFDEEVMNLIKIKAQLTNLINEITNLDLSIYTDDSVQALTAALEEANTVLANSKSTFEELDSAYQTLLAAKNGLVKIEDTDKTALNEAIEKADQIDLSFYTKESADKLETALKAAKIVMLDEGATQEMIDQALADLQDAIDSLVKLSDPQQPGDNGSSGNTKPSSGVNTGDNIDLGTSVLFLLLCGAALVMVKRKKEQNN
ncbi:discoidin domain-containing protein [Thomasclavelia saccharogumia]|uniref:discoidin domain-containing protein n=1 Tax=Thomasclavelia saccharogumia TaxID=341225 RepID=UPI000A076289|nr:discoidin domain-containing protein [Thomasclavelia saccharogumia]